MCYNPTVESHSYNGCLPVGSYMKIVKHALEAFASVYVFNILPFFLHKGFKAKLQSEHHKNFLLKKTIKLIIKLKTTITNGLKITIEVFKFNRYRIYKSCIKL